MEDRLTRLIIEELGRLLPRNQIIEEVCVAGSLRWPEAELLVTLVETEQAHAISRRQVPWLIAISIVLILIGTLPYAAALYAFGLLLGVLSFPGLPPGTQVSIPIPVSGSGLAEMVGGCFASFALLPSGIIGLYQAVRRYAET